MAVTYTHDLKIEIGGVTYEGEVEFNIDGLASYRMAGSPNLRISQVQLLNTLVDLVHHFFEEWSLENPQDLTLVRIKLK